MLRLITRIGSPLAALTVGYLVFPKEWNKSHHLQGHVVHVNEAVVGQLEDTNEFKDLQKNANYRYYRFGDAMPLQHRKNHIGHGLLSGPDMFEIEPIAFLDEQNGQLVSFYHLGKLLTSQDNQIHNGVISTILDEGLCICGFPQLASQKGVTAQLAIDFKNQAPPDTTVRLTARVVEAKGRKVVIDGFLDTFPLDGLDSTRIAEAQCVLVEPKWFRYFLWFKLV
ncbi:uncharacterized protein KQ657_003984 [Scheffersomyces spartinae]|uniref:Thioesterase domain-containing protein n=1 Tax=Scheffersomyces spartinae TaxID=45513 RepID=A0A9P7VB79_9ASCO|nr:uncharacterized protein KQ657_003984 [Scheffersomyces spartinae]KAG7194876.1 hypothetical protein KQ657_003984 [Scheffersomyces spartinae]